jgi:hypothetical protein
MKHLLLALLSTLAIAPSALAYGQAYLVRCDIRYTSGGNMVYVGLYRYQNRNVELYFNEYCPMAVPMESIY